MESVRKTDTDTAAHVCESTKNHGDDAKINNSCNDNNNKGLEIYSINLGILRGSVFYLGECTLIISGNTILQNKLNGVRTTYVFR